MAITVVGTPTNSGNAVSGNSGSVAVPTGAASGDIAVVWLGQWETSLPGLTITPPSGFTQKGTTWTSGAGDARNSVWWKRLTASDTGTYAWSWTVTGGGAAWTTIQCVMFRGCIASGDPWDAVATPVTGTFGSVTSMSVTMTDAGGALFWAVYNDSSGAHTPPTSFTEAADVDSGSCAYRIPGSAGSQTASGASIASSSSAGAWLGALLSAGGGSVTEYARPIIRFAPGLYAPGGVLKPPPLGAATAVPNSIPSAGNAAGTGAANNATPNIGPAAGNAAGTGAANAAVPNVAPAAGNAAGTGTAYQPNITTTGSQNAQAENAAGTGSAGQPTAIVAPAAGNAAGTGTAYQPTVTTQTVAATDPDQARPQAAPMFFNPTWAATQLAGDTYVTPAGSAQAGVATGTGAANQPTIAIAAAAGNAAGTGSANNATVTTGSNTNATAGVATGTGAANNTVITVGPAAGSGSGTGSAGGATDAISVAAGNAAGTGTANAPNVSTTGSTSAQAGLASGTGAANQPSVTVSPPTGAATGTGTAQTARANIGPAAGNAAGTGTANNATVTAPNATAGNAAGTGAAHQPLVVISPAAARATGTGAAANATVSQTVGVAAGHASGVGQAFTTTNGVPVVLYPIAAGTATDLAEREHAGVVTAGGRRSAGTATDQAERYHSS